MAFEITLPASSATEASTYAICFVMRTTSPRHGERLPGLGATHRLVGHVERCRPVALLERAVRGEVHGGVVDHPVHTAVHGAERVAGELGGRPGRGRPPLAVVVEADPELREQRHPAVAERTCHVTRHRGGAYRCRHADRSDRRRRPHTAREAQRLAGRLASGRPRRAHAAQRSSSATTSTRRSSTT